MTSFVEFLLSATCLALVSASGLDVTSDLGRYDNSNNNNNNNGLMTQDLYKHLANIDPSYFRQRDDDVIDDDDEASRDSWRRGASADLRARAVSSRGGKADIRDSEYIGHSLNAGGNQGFISMSGGAGEGKQHLTPDGTIQNIHQVKFDDSLPFYCHPPNPCPKGYTNEDGCHDSIEDSAEVQKAWIEKMTQRGMCSCDEEHMFDCPTGSQRSGSSGDDDRQTSVRNAALDDMLTSILGDKPDDSENPFIGGQKRQTLVAKKSPRVKRAATAAKNSEQKLDKMVSRGGARSNPYLSGVKLPTVAKKGYNPNLN